MNSSLAVFEVAIWVKSMYMIKSLLKTRKKEIKYVHQRNFYIKLHQKYRVEMEFTACCGELLPKGALTSFTKYVTHIVTLWIRHSY